MKFAESGSPVQVYRVGNRYNPIPWWRPRWQYEVTPDPAWGEPWAGRAYTNVGAYKRGMRTFRRWARKTRAEHQAALGQVIGYQTNDGRLYPPEDITIIHQGHAALGQVERDKEPQ